MSYNNNYHSVFDMNYHMIFCTKYFQQVDKKRISWNKGKIVERIFLE